jgi:glycosyltransferase involved in cell wall biosynthesis
VQPSQLPEHFSRAHVFAAPSQYEGGPGFVYLEAMACGLPVIACEGSGVAEVVRHGKNGLLVPPEDVPALTTALRSLFRDATVRQAMGEAARSFVVAEAESRVCIERIEAFYASVANGKWPVATKS